MRHEAMDEGGLLAYERPSGSGSDDPQDGHEVVVRERDTADDVEVPLGAEEVVVELRSKQLPIVDERAAHEDASGGKCLDPRPPEVARLVIRVVCPSPLGIQAGNRGEQHGVGAAFVDVETGHDPSELPGDAIQENRPARVVADGVVEKLDEWKRGRRKLRHARPLEPLAYTKWIMTSQR